MEINAICIRRASNSGNGGDYLYPRDSFPPHLLPPLWGGNSEVHVQTSEATLDHTRPSFRFQHGQITPPLESNETLNQSPSFSPHTFLNTTSAGTRNGSLHDDATRQWQDDIPSAAQRMIATDLNTNRSHEVDREDGEPRVNKDARSDMQDRWPSTGAGVMFHVAEAKVNCGLAAHLDELHL
ncbi:hypothetical protein G4B11_000251 [Aspergillus flavus]|nr:hypothetical protein G4B11_000251 [Aspergillus flavus]